MTIVTRPDSIQDTALLERRVASLERAFQHIDGQQIEDGTIGPGPIGPHVISEAMIRTDFLVTNIMQANEITAGFIASDAIQTRHLDAGSVTTDKMTAGTINANVLVADSVTTIELAAGSVRTDNVYAGAINNTHIQDGVIEGVKLVQGAVTARELHTGFLDARVSSQSYIEAESIKGGEFSLGGSVTYSDTFASSSGGIIYPWDIAGNISETDTPQAFSLGGPGNRKFIVFWNDNKLRVEIEPSKTFNTDDHLTFLYNRQSNNLITDMAFHIKMEIPTGFEVSLVDINNNIIDGFTYTGPYTYETTGDPEDTEPKAFDPHKSAVGFRLRATSNITTAAATKFFEIYTTTFEFERGYGSMRIFDTHNRLRAEMSHEQILFNKLDPVIPLAVQPTFQVTEDGVWIPRDGLTIGSNEVNDLEYKLRDFTGNLVVNSRFEVMRNVDNPNDPGNLYQIPIDWTYIHDTSGAWVPDSTYFGYNEILPQAQSLVSGKVLKMTLANGWGSTHVLKAISHKRYISAETDLNQLPLAISSYFRIAGANKNNVSVKIELYKSSRPSDITGIESVASDILLGSAVLTGAAIDTADLTVDNIVKFQRLAHSFALRTGMDGDTMTLSTEEGAYVYVVLSAWCSSGALSEDHIVEWDNIDCTISEENTPSDSQVEAELARRITQTNTLITHMLSGTKAVLPDLDNGSIGFDMTAVW